MRTILLFVILAAMSAKLYPADPEVTMDIFLRAIALKENCPQDKIGPNGERSIYQISESVWRETMAGIDFEEATTDQWMAFWCATKRINFLANEAARLGFPPNCYVLAAMWHHGVKGYVRLAKAGEVSEFATAVQNLYNSP